MSGIVQKNQSPEATTAWCSNAILYKNTVFGYSGFSDLAGKPGNVTLDTPEGRSSQNMQEVFEMNRIQNWFDQIMGIAQIEQGQRDRAREIFSPSRMDLAGLETPACWRRTVRAPRVAGRPLHGHSNPVG